MGGGKRNVSRVLNPLTYLWTSPKVKIWYIIYQTWDLYWEYSWLYRPRIMQLRLRATFFQKKSTIISKLEIIIDCRKVRLRHKIDTQPEVQLRHVLVPVFHGRHFASKRFWFYEFLFVEIWAVTKHSDSLSTFQSWQWTVYLLKNDINIFRIT